MFAQCAPFFVRNGFTQLTEVVKVNIRRCALCTEPLGLPDFFVEGEACIAYSINPGLDRSIFMEIDLMIVIDWGDAAIVQDQG